jgi:phage terminase Nu1 subunit (DNA packaging protein)
MPEPTPTPSLAGATARELAILWACSERQVIELARDGIAVRLGRGRYDGPVSTTNYIRHLRGQAAGHVGKDSRFDAVKASVLQKQANTRLLEIKMRRIAGRLIEADVAKQTWVQIIRGIRQAVLALPNKIAFAVPTLTHADRDIIEQIVRDDLQDLAMERGFDFTRRDSEDVLSDQEDENGGPEPPSPTAETQAL